MTTNDLLAMIENGECDTDLDMFAEAIRVRRDVLSQRLLRDLNPGDTVRFNEKVRPTYLEGVTATVVRRKQKRVVVTLDESVGRYTGGTDITTPLAIVDKVAAS